MVQVVCAKTGITFEAASKRTKNHPRIMSWLETANRYEWYSDALAALESGKEQGFATIEEYNLLFEQTEKSTQEAKRVAAGVERERKERDRIDRYNYREAIRSEEHPDNIDNSFVPSPVPDNKDKDTSDDN